MTPLPHIHLGGTPTARLMEDYAKAYEALIAARQAFDDIEFNSRDYLPYRSEDSRIPWPQAVEWRERITQAFVDVEEYLLQHMECIWMQSPPKKNRIP